DPKRQRRMATGHIPLTRRAKKSLELSLREALRLHHDHIGTGHLLLGLLREGAGLAARIIADTGIDLGELPEEVARLIATPAARPAVPPGWPAGPGGRQAQSPREGICRLPGYRPIACRPQSGTPAGMFGISRDERFAIARRHSAGYGTESRPEGRRTRSVLWPFAKIHRASAAAPTRRHGLPRPRAVRWSRSIRGFAGLVAAGLLAACAAAPATDLARTAPAAGGVPAQTRTYYLAADTVVWDYAPAGRNLI